MTRDVDNLGQVTTPADRRAPIEGARIARPPSTRAWGAVRTPTEREPAGHIHAGIDVAGAPGTPVVAPEAGLVEQVGTLPMRPPWTGYAPAVLIHGDSGRWHLLAHLSGNATGGPATAPAVAVGQRVELGQVVGYTGAERHTHWEVRTRPHARHSAGEPTWIITIDPAGWLAGEDVPYPDPPPGELDPHRPPHRVQAVEVVTGVPEPDLQSWASSMRSAGRAADDVAGEVERHVERVVELVAGGAERVAVAAGAIAALVDRGLEDAADATASRRPGARRQSARSRAEEG